MTTRRTILAGAAATAAVVATGAWSATVSSTTRQPVLYIPHGGGPWPWMDQAFFGGPGSLDALRRYLESLPSAASQPPKAILAVTAHWEAAVPTVSSAAKPGMLYDYYGFPEDTYKILWPAPGDPALATRVRALLDKGGFRSAEDAERGYDHGTFVPLAVAWPKAEVPVVQLSLIAGLDPDAHIRLGRALTALRDEGVLIVGSGMSYHNMRGFKSSGGAAASVAFDTWMANTVGLPAAQRDAALTRWTDAPGARACHPREEHLLPLMVIAGAAGADVGRVPYRDQILGTTVSAVQFG